MSDKMSMSLDEIVKASRAEKEKSGGKAKREGKGGGGRAAPYSKKGKDGPGGDSQRKKKEPQAKKEKEPKKERPPPKPAKSIYVGNLPFTIEAATVETHLGKVASCTVELKMRKRRGKADGKEEEPLKPAGFAIATFEDVESATKAIEALHGSELEGRALTLRYDHEGSAE